MAHTPGPWEVDYSYQWPSKVRSTVAPYNARWICDCASGLGTAEEMERALDNAHLIASAPDLKADNERLRSDNAELLEALKNVCDDFEPDTEADGWIGQTSKRHIREARAVIAKHEGTDT